MLVRDLMATDVVSVDRDASLATAARTMLSAGVGSVVVTVDDAPAGILTETDALAAGCEADATFADITVAAVASAPLVTVQPDVTIRGAVERMREADVKKLPVVEGMELRGIVTMSDVVLNFRDLLREAHDLESRREGWESERLYDGDVAEILRREG